MGEPSSCSLCSRHLLSMAVVLALQLLTLCEPLQHLLSGSLAKLVQTASLWAPRHLSGERARDKTIGSPRGQVQGD